MSAIILDGAKVAKQWQQQIKERLQDTLEPPRLDVILVGNDAASHLYVQKKQQACEHVGMISQLHRLPDDVSQRELLDRIEQLNHNRQVHGVLLQLPLPCHMATWQVMATIDVHKDVDGLHPYHLGRLVQGMPEIRPCTPKGIMRLLQAYDIELQGLHVAMIGHSNIVGKPMLHECLNAQATVTIAHRATRNLRNVVRQADVVITAIGQKEVIDVDWFKPSSVIIDVGIHRSNHRTSGDIDFAAAKDKVRAITPVPGGVGPMTVSALLDNTWQAFNKLRDLTDL